MRTYGTDWAGQHDLARRSVRGGLITGGGTWLRFVLQLATIVVVARVLGPTEYGTAALVLVVGGAAEILRTSGIATTVIRTAHLAGATTTTLAGIATTAGLVAGGITSVILEAIAPLPGAPLLGVVFLLAGIGSVPTALLTRNLAFSRLAGVELIAVVVSCTGAICLATAGAGASSLIAQAVLFATVVNVGSVVACPWRPSWPAPLDRARSELGFAANVTAVQVLNYTTRNVDRLVIGALFGPAAAGWYTQAVQLLVLPLDQVSGPLQRVALPALSRVHGSAVFARYYRAVLALLTSVLWPVLAVLAVLADDAVAVLFGPEWAPSVPLFRLMLVAGIAQSVGYVTVWTFMATGQAGRQTVWSLVSRPLVLIGMFAGLPWGVPGMTAAYAVGSLVMVVPGFLVVRRRAGLHLRDLLSPLAGTALGGVVAAVTAAVTTLHLDGFTALLVGGVTGSGAALAIATVIPSTRELLRTVIRNIRTHDRRTVRLAQETP